MKPNVHLSKAEIEEILTALYLSVNESQCIDEDANVELQDKLTELLDSITDE